MQFIDLHAQQKRIRDKIEENIKRVLDHGQYIMGPEIKQLEERLAHFVGTKYAVAVASGTDALLISLMAYGVGSGDAVFTTPFTFIATGEVIQLVGAEPVFVDIQPDTFNIDPNHLEAVIKKTKKQGKLKPCGIIPVDLFGQPADYDEINALARPIKWFSVPRLCRAERPQKGRLREFFQWNIDIIGLDDVLADAEVIFCAVDYLRSTGLTEQDVVVRVSSRRMLAEVLKAIGLSEAQLDPGCPSTASISSRVRKPSMDCSKRFMGKKFDSPVVQQIKEIRVTG